MNKKRVTELPNAKKLAHGVVKKHGKVQAPGSEPWPGFEKVLEMEVREIVNKLLED